VLEHVNDLDFLQNLIRGVRGGLQIVNRRYAKSNLEHLTEYDPSQPKTELIFWDFVSLYSKVLMEPLPIGRVKLLDEPELDCLRADNYNGIRNFRVPNKGLVLVVDFYVPEEAQYRLRHLPPGPSKMLLDLNTMSAQQLDLINNYKVDLKAPLASQKLLLTFFPKTEYVVYGRLLAFYQELGVQVTNIHKGWIMDEAPVFRDYIKDIVDLRRNEKDETKRTVLKILLNR